MRMFSWYTDNKPHVSTYLNGAPKKRYLVVYGIDVVGRAVMHYKPNLKGGHRHNQWKNAMARMRKCHICGAPIVKGCEVVSQNGWNEFQCRSCWTDENIEQACLVGISFGGLIYKVRKFRRH